MRSGFGCLLLAAIGIFQIITGYIGIYHAFGWIGFLVVTAIAGVLRTELPFMIGTYVCCAYVWDWPLPIALLAAAPGLLFLIPTAMAIVLDAVGDLRLSKRHTRHPETNSRSISQSDTSPSINDIDASTRAIVARSIFEQPEDPSHIDPPKIITEEYKDMNVTPVVVENHNVSLKKTNWSIKLVYLLLILIMAGIGKLVGRNAGESIISAITGRSQDTRQNTVSYTRRKPTMYPISESENKSDFSDFKEAGEWLLKNYSENQKLQIKDSIEFVSIGGIIFALPKPDATIIYNKHPTDAIDDFNIKYSFISNEKKDPIYLYSIAELSLLYGSDDLKYKDISPVFVSSMKSIIKDISVNKGEKIPSVGNKSISVSYTGDIITHEDSEDFFTVSLESESIVNSIRVCMDSVESFFIHNDMPIKMTVLRAGIQHYSQDAFERLQSWRNAFISENKPEVGADTTTSKEISP